MDHEQMTAWIKDTFDNRIYNSKQVYAIVLNNKWSKHQANVSIFLDNLEETITSLLSISRTHSCRIKASSLSMQLFQSYYKHLYSCSTGESCGVGESFLQDFLEIFKRWPQNILILETCFQILILDIIINNSIDSH